MSQAPANTISVTDLDLPQLQDVKRQLDEELTHLTNSYSQLKQAHSKFRTCLDCVKEVRPGNARKTILVPLSSSLYVNGKLSNPDRVLIDVGTGYYVSKTRDQATLHYERKIEFVDNNLRTVQGAIEKKQENLNLVLQVMQMRMGQATQAPKER
ncbi:Prefoldin-domain-containing protein [Calocera viscosa TUFC12733]|uniref:Prefoldin-domain-containing protein n=1 Tax=Calocera viscosa (strain TUFC12733) TaxID=1330018 RepID=A0A167N1G7_CALVF|nr:Prefoldin-domain-containing protein [Calocera viscosa TUFC12733]